MAKLLSASALAQYHRDGFYVPIRVLSREEAAGYRRRLETYEAEHGGALRRELRHKTHLLFTWLDRLVRHPRILDAVEDILGPNLLCWSSSFFIKEASDPAFVSWHQDATYWGLSKPDVVTAWVAFTDATVENGAMRMVPSRWRTETRSPRPTFFHAARRSRSRWTRRRPSTSCSRREACRSTTCSCSTARRRIARPIAASATPSATSRRTCARSPVTATARSWCVASTSTTTSSPRSRP